MAKDNQDVLDLLKVLTHSRDLPNLKAIHDLAMLQLVDAAAEAQKELDERAKEKAEAEAKAKAEADAKAAAEKKAAEAKAKADEKAASYKAA